MSSMKARFKQKLPEEIELEQKRAELVALRARHAGACAALQRLRDEISRFERGYENNLGRRIAELERIEAEISRVDGYSSWENQRFESNSSSGDDAFGADGSDQRASLSESESDDIKALYREVAKTIHPDLAGSAPGNANRHELMLKANRAYAEDDHRTLREILRDWRRSPDQAAEEEDVGAELVSVIRQIARERQDIRAVNAKMEDLKGSYVWRFKLRVEANLAMGIDLLAEMVAEVDQDIVRSLRRLAALKGDPPPEPLQKQQKQRRCLAFPADFSCGTLYLRDRTSLDYSQWKKVGPAKGCLEVYVDMAVRLDVKEQESINLGSLRHLKPDDLQALFLYEVADSDLDHIFHLTGLEELYLSGARLTDATLSRISSFTYLKRIYLYHTGISDRGLVYLQRLPGLKGITSSGNSITEEGLAGVRQAIPGVKIVTFPWKK